MSRRTHGALALGVGPAASAAAPVSGVRAGVGRDGPVLVRLFRLAGTRVVLAGRVLPAQLFALRVAAAGTPVHVLTQRPQVWGPLLLTGPGTQSTGHTVGQLEPRADGGGPNLVVDDRQAEARTPGDLRPWQCRVDVRPQWAPAALGAFAHADLTVLGAVAPDLLPAVARAFALPAAAVQPLARLDGGSFALVRRGRIEYVALDPTAAESRLLDLARGGAGQPQAAVQVR